jgi:salicylate hydroxylase/6-hydroxynicotinate 3-monooxygenase
VTSTPEKAEWIPKESRSAKADLDELQQGFSAFHPDAHRWGIFERNPLPVWTRGAITLLGASYCPMTHDMASGAAMALEDAVILARCLESVDRANINAAFKTYEATRKQRTTSVQMGSSANNWMRNANNPDWLYGYDTWTASLEAAEKVSV